MVTSCTGLVLNIEADPSLTEAKRGTGNSRALKDHWYLTLVGCQLLEVKSDIYL
jgi:hypothetical protein